MLAGGVTWSHGECALLVRSLTATAEGATRQRGVNRGRLKEREKSFVSTLTRIIISVLRLCSCNLPLLHSSGSAQSVQHALGKKPPRQAGQGLSRRLSSMQTDALTAGGLAAETGLDIVAAA
ncbi:hypothetical protein Q8A73_001676 [Channa argus]|nr:hypothetical protein Q8A73_001676 [Channa argus]